MRTFFTFSVSVASLLAALAFAAPAAASDRTVKLLAAKTVRAFPGGGKKIATVKAVQPLTGSPTVLPVIGRAIANGRPWVRVRLPQRPNGATGWILADGTRPGRSAWRVRVSRAQRTAVVYRNGRKVRAFRVVIGAPRTPTPAGTFFITEKVRQPHGAAVGPVVLATSAYSNVLQEFDGGPGQIGLHGRTGLPGPLGSAASHGCIRFDDRAIRWLAARVSAGATVKVV